MTEADATLYLALTGSRFGVLCSETLARTAGLPRPPLEDLLAEVQKIRQLQSDAGTKEVANG